MLIGCIMNVVLVVIYAERYSRPYMELWNIGEIFTFINKDVSILYF